MIHINRSYDLWNIMILWSGLYKELHVGTTMAQYYKKWANKIMGKPKSIHSSQVANNWDVHRPLYSLLVESEGEQPIVRATAGQDIFFTICVALFMCPGGLWSSLLRASVSHQLLTPSCHSRQPVKIGTAMYKYPNHVTCCHLQPCVLTHVK